MADDFLPIDAPAAAVTSTPRTMSDAVAELADTLAPPEGNDPTQVRIGTITNVTDPLNQDRVQLDITSTAWCSTAHDLTLAVGNRVCVLQQGPVFIVIARLSGGEASPIGIMQPFAGATAPVGWLLCNGQAVSRATYATLFSTIGTTYGSGNGSTTFNVPNAQDRMLVGSGGSYTRGTTGGAATVTLGTGEMPSHNHGLSGASASSAGGHSHGGSSDFVGDHSHSYTNASSTRSDINASAGSTANNGSFGSSTGGAGGHSHGISTDSQGSHSHSVSGSVSSTGGGGSHENMSPFLAVPCIIRAL